jgi:hypothetical protein
MRPAAASKLKLAKSVRPPEAPYGLGGDPDWEISKQEIHAIERLEDCWGVHTVFEPDTRMVTIYKISPEREREHPPLRQFPLKSRSLPDP